MVELGVQADDCVVLLHDQTGVLRVPEIVAASPTAAAVQFQQTD